MARKIGLLGGSFNPAHSGHLHVAQTALKRLQLDEVWWIVARGNPLKSDHGDYATRLASARAVARSPNMRVSDVEAEAGLTYTIDTLAHLQRGNRDKAFVWLMGSDNLASFHQWRNWRDIARVVPIAIIARPGFRPGRSVFEHVFQTARLAERAAPLLPSKPAPAWVYLKAPFNPQSSTQIRAARKA